MKDLFLLSESVCYLSHGTFGSCPKPIFEEYQNLQLQMEAKPIEFILSTTPKLLEEARELLGNFVGCSASDLFFTPNPSTACNAIMRSLKLNKGDEILATNLEYGAMDKMWSFYEQKTGVKYIRQNITLPLVSKEEFLKEFWKGYNSKTKVVFMNQLTSATALIFPVKEICQKAKELGLLTIIDGAHVPGHIPLDLSDLDPDFYTGTLHKWMLAPKGSSFLYVKKSLQSYLEPSIISWGYKTDTPGISTFIDENEYQGTRDSSAYLCTKKAIEFISDPIWELQKTKSKELVLTNYARFCSLVHTKPLCPISFEFLGQMASIPINTKNPLELKKILYENYKIEIPVMTINSENYLRYSVNAYNSQSDLDLLYSALESIIQETQLIQI